MTIDRVKMASLRSDLADIINRVRFHNSRVTIMRHGEPVATILSNDQVAEYDRLKSMYRTVGEPRTAA